MVNTLVDFGSKTQLSNELCGGESVKSKNALVYKALSIGSLPPGKGDKDPQPCRQAQGPSADHSPL